MSEKKSCRVTVALPANVKDWYQREAERYKLPMSGYMAMLLIKNYENQENMELLKQMNLLNQQMDNGNVDVKELAESLATQMQQLSKSIKDK